MPMTDFVNLNNKEIRGMVGDSDLIHIQRNIVFPEVQNAVRYWQGAGKTITLDLDDAYTMLPPTNPAYEFWNQNITGLPEPPLETLKKWVGEVDAFTSPSKRILEDWKGTYKVGIWWPNFTTGAWYEKVVKEPHEGIVIGWGGSSSHYDTFWFTPVCEALKKVCELRPQVRIRICGFDVRILDLLDVPNKEHVPFVPPDEWPKNIAQFDIGIAPLAEEYDQRRSWLKGIEFGLAKVPWVGTEGWPYKDLGYGTLVPNTVEAWVSALIDKIDNPQDPMPDYLKALEYTMERQAPHLAEVLTKLVWAKKFRQGKAGLPDVTYV
jgi:hypothetical protein